MGIEALAKALKPINPAGRNPDGACFAIAREVADVLTTGKPPANQSGNRDGNFKGLQEALTLPGKKQGEKAWEWMVKTMAPHFVYTAEDDGHCWDMVKGGGGALYLLDASTHTFKAVQSIDQYTITFMGDGEVEGGGVQVRNMLKKYEDYLIFHLAGSLTREYKALLDG